MKKIKKSPFFLIQAGIAILLLIAVCNKAAKEIRPVMVEEIYQTRRHEPDNIDSPALWHGAQGEHWVIATAKKGDALIVTDAVTGELIRRVGTSGSEPGQFSRPNGIFVIDNYALIVERDNRRVQVLTLPNFKSMGSFGESILQKPYGLFVFSEKDVYTVFVTDNYETEAETVPPDSLLDQRICQFSLTLSDGQMDWECVKQFGAASGFGVLNTVESIYADVPNNQLLIAEEDTTQSSVKVYNLQGQFTGIVFGTHIFNHQVEGIALYETGDCGYWIVTDQSHDHNQFHLFQRKTFDYAASFAGPLTTNTDGIWLDPTPFGPFKQGLFVAIHNDGNVSAFDWQRILNALGL